MFPLGGWLATTLLSIEPQTLSQNYGRSTAHKHKRAWVCSMVGYKRTFHIANVLVRVASCISSSVSSEIQMCPTIYACIFLGQQQGWWLHYYIKPSLSDESEWAGDCWFFFDLLNGCNLHSDHFLSLLIAIYRRKSFHPHRCYWRQTGLDGQADMSCNFSNSRAGRGWVQECGTTMTFSSAFGDVQQSFNCKQAEVAKRQPWKIYELKKAFSGVRCLQDGFRCEAS